MKTIMQLDPLFRQSIGFDRFKDLFENLAHSEKGGVPSYPAYNIEKIDDETYLITMAVAGFSEKDLSIVAQENALVVSGKLGDMESEKSRDYLHKGIATRSFERKFRLADRIVVSDAELNHGLLNITLKVIIPEEAKPRVIPIKSDETPTLEN
jgi:molecular chaperone IbpA